MTEFSFSTGIIIGVFLYLGRDIIKEILLKKYDLRQKKGEIIKEIKKDLKSYITIVFRMWDNYKSLKILCPNFKEDMKIKINELVEFFTASVDLKRDLVNKIRKVCSEFLILIQNPNPDWFQTIKYDGDNLCNEFREIVNIL